MAKPFEPKIVSANDLLMGDVVYLDRSGTWTRRLDAAAVAETPEAADDLLAAAAAQPDQVVGPYLADVILRDGAISVLLHLREKLRDRGPSSRPDLGRQSEPDSDPGSLFAGSGI